ncbi:MAG: hypothetical protein ACM3YM_11495, partial [Sphingomonadales bacterium]
MVNCLKGGLRAAIFAVAAIGLSAPSQAQIFLKDPGFSHGDVEGADPLVGLPLPGATPTEYGAHLLWNLRAGLNVAALQCQFSPFLRTVDNYNGLLAHHSKELMSAYTTLGTYFKKKYGPSEGQRLFDDYSTKTYNNWSTLYAQYGFCQTAADIAKEGIERPKGQLYLTARGRLRELRSSLVPTNAVVAFDYNPYSIANIWLPPLDDRCWDRKGNLRKKCQPTYASNR